MIFNDRHYVTTSNERRLRRFVVMKTTLVHRGKTFFRYEAVSYHFTYRGAWRVAHRLNRENGRTA